MIKEPRGRVEQRHQRSEIETQQIRVTRVCILVESTGRERVELGCNIGLHSIEGEGVLELAVRVPTERVCGGFARSQVLEQGRAVMRVQSGVAREVQTFSESAVERVTLAENLLLSASTDAYLMMGASS